MSVEKINGYLKEARIKSNLTQEELSEKSGVNIKTIQQYEQNPQKMKKGSMENLLRLAKALNCNVDSLFMEHSMEISGLYPYENLKDAITIIKDYIQTSITIINGKEGSGKHTLANSLIKEFGVSPLSDCIVSGKDAFSNCNYLVIMLDTKEKQKIIREIYRIDCNIVSLLWEYGRNKAELYIKDLMRERELLDSIMKCMLRYCNEHTGIDAYAKEMQELTNKYENQVEQKLLQLTGKDYFQLQEDKINKQ